MSEPTEVIIANKPVSFQVVQDVYHSLTGKTEHIAKLLFEPHTVRVNDIENLHSSLETMLEQYQCHGSSVTINVRYIDGSTSLASGMNRFRLDVGAKNCPVESVEIEYSFMIVLPKTNEPKTYKLEVGLRSTAGIAERLMQQNSSETERHFFYEMDNATARIEIHNVDLAVARSLEAVVEKWYESLPKYPRKLLISSVSIAKAIVAPALRISALLASAYFCFVFFAESIASEQTLFRAGLGSFVAISAAMAIVMPLSFYLRRRLIEQRAHSLVHFTDFDKSLIIKHRNSMIGNLFKSGLSVLLAIGTGLLTAYIAYQIGW